MSSSSKNWCFTLNNYTSQEVDTVKALTGLKYLVFGFEVGESGTPHLQGFCIHEKKTSLGKMKELIPRAHWEMAKGTAAQAATYCKKDGNYFQVGEEPVSAGESKKRQWTEITDLAKRGKFDELIEKYPAMYLRYHKGFKDVHRQIGVKPKTLSEMDHYWYYGPTGTGKTSRAFELYPDAYIKNPDKWWCDYAGEETVIIDDWDPDHHYMVAHLKKWCQNAPTRVETKGGGMVIRPKRIIVTSQYTFDECFFRQRDVDALKRRFKLLEFKNQ